MGIESTILNSTAVATCSSTRRLTSSDCVSVVLMLLALRQRPSADEMRRDHENDAHAVTQSLVVVVIDGRQPAGRGIEEIETNIDDQNQPIRAEPTIDDDERRSATSTID